MGDSRGKWEGDTLVVDADHINYAATIEDPKFFTRPWTMNLVFYRHTEPDFRLLDYECYAFALDVCRSYQRSDSLIHHREGATKAGRRQPAVSSSSQTVVSSPAEHA